MRSPLWGYVFFMGIVILVGFIGAFRASRNIAKRVVCGIKLEALSVAIQVYTDTYEGRYPTPQKWCDLIIQNPGELIEDAFCCPVDPKGSFSYAINKNLYKLEPNDVPSRMVLLFEANLGRNGVGGPEDWVLRHTEDDQLGCNIGFADGHVEFVTEDRIGDLIWMVE